MPDREACRGTDSNFRCKSSSEAHEQEVRHDVCFQCNAGKRPATRSPSPQRRPPVQRAQNCFGDDASAVSHRQVGRGRAPEGTSWTGSQHEFDNPTSADATASPRSETAAAANTTVVRRGSKRLAVFGWLSCIRDTTLLVNGKCISDQYHEDECQDAASVAASSANCAVTRKTMNGTCTGQKRRTAIRSDVTTCHMHAHTVTAEQHNVYRDAPVFRLFLNDDCEDEGEEESKQGSQHADEGECEPIEEDDEQTTFGLVGPYKAPAIGEVVPEETVANSMERGLHLQGFITGRKVVHLFKHPDG